MPGAPRIEHIDYIQRSNESFASAPKDLFPANTGSLFINLLRVRKISSPFRFDRIATEYVLTGLYGIDASPAFLLKNEQNELSIYVGVWGEREEDYKGPLNVLSVLLKSIYSHVEAFPVGFKPGSVYSRNGIVLGVPSAKIFEETDTDKRNQLPLDKLLNALSLTSDWQVLILAQPVKIDTVNKFLNNVLAEQRDVQRLINDQQVPNPLAEYYSDMLDKEKENIELSKEIGAWKTGVFLSAQGADFDALSGLWKAVYSGDDSLPTPIRTVEIPLATGTSNGKPWFADLPGTPGPGTYAHLSKYLSFLNSKQLSAYIHFPNFELPGINIIKIPEFDSVQQPVSTTVNSISLGKIYHGKEPTSHEYVFNTDHLSRHCFVCGTTGSGKTNTVFNILQQASSKGIHFLVIESAKAEYRSLLKDKNLDDLQVFTLGNETIAPLRFNPFQVLPGIPVSVHLDLLRSVFSAGFGMWTPLPQVLEQCLYKIYEDRGWNLSYDINQRLKPGIYSPLAFPTMTDLYEKIEPVVNGLGYDQKSRDDIKAALLTRVNSLRVGGKGNMLDTQQEFPIGGLLDKSTVLELEGIGDDDDKAFLIGIFFIFLVEYRRTQRKGNPKRHILVIEEAHRLLKNVPDNVPQEQGNPRGKAVETFANLLSEIRAYGQGVIVSDQIPVKLAPEIIKNTNLKIAHRIISKDDRDTLAGSMGLEEEQSSYFSILTEGEAVVFAEGDDKPLMIKSPSVKMELGPNPPSNEEVKSRMAGAVSGGNTVAACVARETAKAMISKRGLRKDFVRLVTSVAESDAPFDPLWDQLLQRIQSNCQENSDNREVVHFTMMQLCEWYVRKRGDQAKWYYSDAAELLEKLQSLVNAKLARKEIKEPLVALREWMFRLHIRSNDPFKNCSAVCAKRNGSGAYCMYRHTVEEFISNSNENALLDYWRKKRQENSQGDVGGLVEIALSVADHLVLSIPETREIRTRIGSCYALHMQRYDFQEFNDKTVPAVLDKLIQIQ